MDFHFLAIICLKFWRFQPKSIKIYVSNLPNFRSFPPIMQKDCGSSANERHEAGLFGLGQAGRASNSHGEGPPREHV
jgi:hypothetical protein